MQSIALRKNMKPLMATLALLIACFHLCSGQGRNCIELDIASAIIYGQVRLSIGHALNESWSVKAETSVNPSRFIDREDEEEREHWGKLYNKWLQHGSRDIPLAETGVSFQFWPRRTFEGPVICFGGLIGDKGQADLTAGLGYHCGIWKNLNAAISYCTDIIDCINNGFKPVKGLRISLNYVF